MIDATEATDAVDPIDEAIAATEPLFPAGATHFTLNVNLPNDRTASIAVPAGLTALDVFLLTDVLHQYLRQQPAVNPARSRIVIPR